MAGDKNSICQFIDLLNARTGSKYDLNDDRIVRVGKVNERKHVKGETSKWLFFAVESAIEKGNVLFIFTDPNDDDNDYIQFDRFSDAKIDMGDINKIRSPEFQAALLTHILQEYITGAHMRGVRQRNEEFDNHHIPAVMAESVVIKEMTGVYGERKGTERRVGYHIDVTVEYGKLKYAYQIHYRKFGRILGFIDRVK